MTGLGSATIYLFAYFAQCIIVLILKIIINISGERFIKKKYFEVIIKDLFFNTLISLTLEGFLEFIVVSILNFQTIDLTLNGEVLGCLIMSFCLFCSMIFVPLALIWALLTKNEE